ELGRTAADRKGLLSEISVLRGVRGELEEELALARRQSAESERKRAGAEEEQTRADMAEKALAAEVERVGAALARATSRESSLTLSRLQALAELDASRAALGRVFEELEGLRTRQDRELERLRSELQGVHTELARLTSLKVFRYSAPLRAVYRRLLVLRRSCGGR
nr:hypothetical protein [Acidobacteriota bacterium]